jgi:hypothetical protein
LKTEEQKYNKIRVHVIEEHLDRYRPYKHDRSCCFEGFFFLEGVDPNRENKKHIKDEGPRRSIKQKEKKKQTNSYKEREGERTSDPAVIIKRTNQRNKLYKRGVEKKKEVIKANSITSCGSNKQR